MTSCIRVVRAHLSHAVAAWSFVVVAAVAGPAPVRAAGGAPAKAPLAPIVLPAPKDLAAAIESIERATGVKGAAIEAGEPSIPLAEGRSFAMDARTADALLEGSHTTFRKAGIYLFRYERSYGVPGERDLVAVLPTTDPDVVLRRIGTSGHKHGVTNEHIIAWLHALEQDEQFEITEVGVDYVAGRFLRAPRDPAALAHRTVEIAPDLVAGHSDPIAGLTDLIGVQRKLFLIWD